MPLDFNELRQLLVTIAQTDIGELILKSDDFELTVRKAVPGSEQLRPVGELVMRDVMGSSSISTSPAYPSVTSGTGMEIVTSRVVDTTVAMQSSAAAPPQIEMRWVEIPSPMVGTFYRAPAPSEPAFVEVGDRIRNGQTVCIIEAMKLMNEIEAEVSGQVMEVLVQNGDPVEYGQPLMRINPD